MVQLSDAVTTRNEATLNLCYVLGHYSAHEPIFWQSARYSVSLHMYTEVFRLVVHNSTIQT